MNFPEIQDWATAILDLSLVYFVIYRILLIIKGTRAVPMLIGLVVIAVLYYFSQEAFLDLRTFNWLLEQFIASLFLIVVVLFQSDIRRALAAFGRTEFLTSFRSGQGAQVIDEVVKACTALANQSVGALIVLEREADLSPFLEESTKLDARVSRDLLYSLFVPERQNPLHDGAVVVRQGRIEAAGVFLPMSVNPQIDRSLGTRHRAALGLSEETDAVVIVVSEERSSISIAFEGVLQRDLSPSEVRQRITDLLTRRPTRLFKRSQLAGEPSAAPGLFEDVRPAAPTAPPASVPPPEEEPVS